MTVLPRSLNVPSPLNTAFLRQSRESLDHLHAVVRGARRERCRQAFDAALAGALTPIAAAAALFEAHQDNQLGQLTAEGVVARIERFPLGRAPDRIGDLLGVVRRALEQPGAEELEVTEVTLNRPAHRLMTLNGYLDSGDTRPFHDHYIHPARTSIWRYLPLPVLIAGALPAGHPNVTIQLTAQGSTLDEIRALMAAAEPMRPLCVPCPHRTAPLDADDASAFAFEAYEIHGAAVDAYRMTLHDLSHLIAVNRQPPDRPREAVLLYDVLRACLAQAPPPRRYGGWAHELIDQLISGYAGIAESVAYVERQCRNAARDSDGAWAVALAEDFRTRVSAVSDRDRRRPS